MRIRQTFKIKKVQCLLSFLIPSFFVVESQAKHEAKVKNNTMLSLNE